MSYVLAFLASGIVVALAGAALARYADAIAEVTKLGRLWIGSVLLAAATSLPELTTDISAVRLGLVQPGSLFAALDPTHALSGLFAVVLMSLGLAAIVSRASAVLR